MHNTDSVHNDHSGYSGDRFYSGYSDDSDCSDRSDVEDSTYQDDERIFKMLGGRTPAQFVQLPLERRQALYRRNLVQKAPVIIEEGDDDDEMNPDIASGVCLRQQYFMGFNEFGKQIVKEATEVYYGENDFRVRLHWLCEFKTDVLGDHKTPVDTASLVRGTLKVYADLHDNNHVYASEPGYGVAALPKWSMDRLRDLLLFTRARRVVLVLATGLRL